MRSVRLALYVLLGLLVLAAGILFVSVDILAQRAVERGATRALGTPTRVGSAQLRLLRGGLSLRGVAVANPEGFDGDFLRLDDARLEVELGTLRQRTVRAPSLELRDVEVRLERRAGRTNYRVIIDHLGSGERPAREGAGRRFVIDQVRIRDVVAYVQLVPAAGRATELELRIPEIRLAGVGERTNGVVVSQLSAILVQAILDALARKGVGLPTDLAAELRARLAGLARVPIRLPEDAIRKGGEAAGEALEGAGRALRGLGDRLRRSE